MTRSQGIDRVARYRVSSVWACLHSLISKCNYTISLWLHIVQSKIIGWFLDYQSLYFIQSLLWTTGSMLTTEESISYQSAAVQHLLKEIPLYYGWLNGLNIKVVPLLENLIVNCLILKSFNGFKLTGECSYLNLFGLEVDVIRCFGHLSLVLHKRKVCVPPYLHEVHIENLQVDWHAGKVDQLQKRPNIQISFECWHQFVLQLVLGALEIFSLQLADKNVEAGDGDTRKDGLSEKKLLAY